MTECIYCQHEISRPDNVPAVSDTAAWERLAEEHAAGCEWVTTRAHRLSRVVIRLVTAPGTNATSIGCAYEGFDGVAHHDAVDSWDVHGYGRVFLDCDDEEVADFVREELEKDDRVVSYS